MQIVSVEKTFEQERKALKLQVFELEKKLDGVNQELAVLKSTLASRNSEIAALQNNLKELDELREMKEVMIKYFPLLAWTYFNFKFLKLRIPCLINMFDFRISIERMSKQLHY